MKLKVLSNYDGDINTRFGDCILLHGNSTSLVVYDCGHTKHAEAVGDFLKAKPSISQVHIVISHNDTDHTGGVLDLFEILDVGGYNVTVYSSLYLKSVQKILNLLDDGRRTKDAAKRHILETFDNIRDIVVKATEYEFAVINATVDTKVTSGCTVVGPTEDEFVTVVTKAIEDGDVSQIESETVMNAASIQLKCHLEDGSNALLCGDATPQYLPDLGGYRVVQLPHHGKLKSAEAIFDKIEKRLMGEYTFIVSDNTGSTNAGSDDLMKPGGIRLGKKIRNTRSGNPVEIGAKGFPTILSARENHGIML